MNSELQKCLSKILPTISTKKEALVEVSKIVRVLETNENTNLKDYEDIISNLSTCPEITKLMSILMPNKEVSRKEIEKISSNPLFVGVIENYCSFQNITIIENNPSEIITKEDKDLFLKAQQGDNKAMEILLKKNEGLVAKFLKSYITPDIEPEDMMQDGRIALMRAIRLYNPSKNCRFSTLASIFIKFSLNNTKRTTNRGLYYSAHAREKLNRYNKAIINFQMLNGRKPSSEELSEILSLPLSTIENLTKYNSTPLSINQEVGPDSDVTLEACVADHSVNLEKSYITKDFQLRFRKFLEEAPISEKERIILERRNGFNSSPQTHQEIGLDLGITKERVRQIEAAALRKLRKSPQLLEFVSYLERPNEDLTKLLFFNYQNSDNRATKSLDKAYQKHREELFKTSDLIEYFHTLGYTTSDFYVVLSTLNNEELAIINNYYDGNYHKREYPLEVPSNNSQDLYFILDNRLLKGFSTQVLEGTIDMPKPKVKTRKRSYSRAK